MTDRLDKNTRAALAQNLLSRFLDQVDIDDRLAQIEERLNSQAHNICEAHQNHDRLCIRVANLESQVSTVVNVQDSHDARLSNLEAKVSQEATLRECHTGRILAHDDRMDRLQGALHNHDARLSDLEGEDRKVVLEDTKGPDYTNVPVALKMVVANLRAVQDNFANFYNHDYTYEELAKQMGAHLDRLVDLLGLPR